jgi:hypothetical protein
VATAISVGQPASYQVNAGCQVALKAKWLEAHARAALRSAHKITIDDCRSREKLSIMLPDHQLAVAFLAITNTVVKAPAQGSNHLITPGAGSKDRSYDNGPVSMTP